MTGWWVTSLSPIISTAPESPFLAAAFVPAMWCTPSSSAWRCFSTVGYGEMAPASLYGHVVASIEILIGMTFMAIFTGILFVRFSRPKAKILFPDNLVVTPHNGQPTLMVRIANGRLTMLTHASAHLTVMVEETNQEGSIPPDGLRSRLV